jgi:hypothetical protein
MQSEVRARLRLKGVANRLPRWLAVLFPCSIAGSLLGQNILTPPPGFQGAPIVPALGNVSGTVGVPNAQANGQANGQANAPDSGQANTSASGQTTGEGGESTDTDKTTATAPLTSLMQWGAVHVRARASYQFLYDSGVNSQPGKSSGTYTHTFTPGLTVLAGPHVSLDYSPSFRFFSNREFHNTVDQFASMSAGIGLEDWSFGFSQSFTLTDEPQIETGGQTEQKDYSAGLSATYQFNDKISFQTSAGLSLTYLNGTNTLVTGVSNAPPSQLSDSQSYNVSEWINYAFDERFTGGVGITVGRSKQDGGFSSMNEQYSGRVSWHPGKKLSMSITGGIEDEQILIHGAPDIVTPIFSAQIGYQLFEHTSLSLSAARSVDVSLFQNQVTEGTQVGIGLQQRLLGLLQLSVGFGYSTTEYKNTFGFFKTSRSDTGTSYSVGLNCPFKKHFNVATFYQYNQSQSSLDGYGTSGSQMGASLNWSY